MSDETVKFSVLCSMFEAMLRNKASSKKRKQFRTFLDRVYTSHDYFSAVRLVLPWLDRERGSYGLKEHVLATCIIDALSMSRESEDALRFINWRRGGAKMGANAGNFALVASEILQRRQGTASGGLTIKELNDLLDRLASADNRVEKTSVLSDLIKKTNALEMKWIVMIILKDLKLGVSEKNIFYEFHPDAQDLFNVTCDLKLVCEKLKNRTQRYKRQDIEVGKPVRPQLALRVADATTAWKKLHGKQVVVECKFDGDRMQIHKNGSEIFYFSRNFLEHPEYGHAMSKIIQQCVQVDKCILDGEMLVWDTSTRRFADFGSNQEIAKAEQEGLESDRQLCYVAFDILYVGDTSVIHQSLRERHELLRKVIKPLKGRLEILVPNGGLNPSCPSGEPCWSLTAYNVEDVERFFKETIENRDEGIVLKDLESKWEPADRSAKWLKLKPDYIHPGSDLDVIIIGGYFGTGRHGGEVAQFLLGLAERSTANSYPKRFISFCRVGTGLSDAEHDALVTKLKPYFRKNENPKKAPHFYGVTNKERPDVWIESPEKSIIVSINCDIRTIKSSVFASPYGLRFPRVIQVRYDKPWYECLDVQSFVDLVQSHNGNTQRGTDHGDSQIHKPKRVKSSVRGGKKIVSVPSHLIQTDVSDTKKGSLIFTNMMFYFVNAPPNFSIDSFRKMVVENGGNFSMNLNDSVTHCIAAERKGIKYQAAMRHSDIIHYSWILDCCSEKRLLHLQPKYFLHFTNSSRSKLQDEVDTFSDYYYWDIDVTDIKQIFYNMNGSCLGDPKSIEHYKKKICPMEKWSLFQDCHIYFYHSAQPLNLDCKVILEISLRRMKLEVSTRGGQVSNSLSNATHLVVFSFTESGLDIATELNSFPAAQKHLLNSKKLHVLRHQWLEDSLVNGKKLSEDAYSLNPNGLDELSKQSESCSNIPATSDNNKHQILSASTHWKAIQQKPTPSRTTNAKRGRAGSKQVRRTRARIGNRPAKISRDESENSDSSEESSETEKPGLRRDEFERAQQKDGNSSRRKQLHNTSKAKRGRAGVKQARSTRALIGNRPTKISRDEYKSIDSSDEVIGMEEVGSRRDGSKNAHGSKKEETKGTQAVEMDKISRFEGFVQTEIEEEKMKDTQGGETDKGKEEFESSREGEDGIPGIEEKISSAQNHECESTIDPLQAMLLDMIPGLDVKNNKTKNASFSDEKSQFDTGSSPVKKKRVSYKDIASQFFKDE